MLKNKIKVLHLVSGNFNGGAAKGSYTLHLELLNKNIDSKIYTNSILNDNYVNVFTSSNNFINKIIKIFKSSLDKYWPKFLYSKNLKTPFSTGLIGENFTKNKFYKDADIIHLHWINNGFVDIKQLSKIDKPIIWTIRDLWPMTGGCHYTLGCENFKTHCNTCPQLGSLKYKDLSFSIFNEKLKNYPASITLVGISEWVSRQAMDSKIFKGYNITTIYNSIDITEFHPEDKIIAKEKLNIKTQKKIILIGAQHLESPYKGFNKFIEALRFLDMSNLYVIFFGSLNKETTDDFNFEYNNFGFVNHTEELRLLYSCADVFVAPSLNEAFGKTIAESMACGTPVISFDATGPKYLINHKKTGYKAKPFDSEDLANGIRWVLDNSNIENMNLLSRQRAVNEYNIEKNANKYIDLYRNMLKTDSQSE